MIKVSRSQSFSTTNLRAAFAALFLLLLAATVSLVYFSWRETKADQQKYLAGLAEISARATDSYFRNLETTLSLLEAQIGGAQALQDRERTRQLFVQFVQTNPDIVNLTLVDVSGQMLVSAIPPTNGKLPNFANRPTFSLALQRLREGHNFELARSHIGPIMQSWVMPLRHAIRDTDGAVAYVLSAILPIERQHYLWKDVPLPVGAAMGLVRDDGFLLSRFPMPHANDLERIYGDPKSSETIFNTLSKLDFPKQGVAEGAGRYSIYRVYAFRRLERYPVTLFVGLPVSHFWAAWSGRMQLPFLLIFLLGLGGWVVYRRVLKNQISWEKERDLTQARIGQLAYYDLLTELPNRALLQERLNYFIQDVRKRNTTLAVLYFDLDRFKNINDSLGHLVGDKLLQIVSERMRAWLADSGIASRVGGDEFVIVLPGASRDEANRIAYELLAIVSRPMEIAGHVLTITPSIGISVFPLDGNDMETLLKHADAAMYAAKESGRNNIQLFNAEMNAKANQRMLTELGLRHGLRGAEFCLYYQPQFDIRTGNIVGIEALVRWQPSEGVMRYPDEFIPVAEDSGLILALGEWVVDAACKQLQAWRKAGLPTVRLALNLSAKQFHQPDLFERLVAIMEKYDLEHSILEFELTESAVMDYSSVVLSTLTQLKQSEFQLALDDFGTGYASLTYLKRLPLNKIKIDRSFIHDILIDPDDAMIVRAIIQLGRNLKLTVVAEGVETAAQYQLVHDWGCDEVQGDYFSKPLPASQIAELLLHAHNDAWREIDAEHS